MYLDLDFIIIIVVVVYDLVISVVIFNVVTVVVVVFVFVVNVVACVTAAAIDTISVSDHDYFAIVFFSVTVSAVVDIAYDGRGGG